MYRYLCIGQGLFLKSLCYREDLMNIARTTLSSKILSQHKDFFANLAVDAVLRQLLLCRYILLYLTPSCFLLSRLYVVIGTWTKIFTYCRKILALKRLVWLGSQLKSINWPEQVDLLLCWGYRICCLKDNSSE